MIPFSSLGLSQHILQALASEGYNTPTPIQEKAIPPGLEGRDVLGCAQTGTGKTAAYALPILQHLHRPDSGAQQRRHPQALILAPTRELASQIYDSFRIYGRHTGLRQCAIYGGVDQGQQVRALRSGVDIVIATPGRLLDLVEQRLLNLSSVRFFVLDEADRMLDMGFVEPITQIARMVSATRQTLLFSATMPHEILRLAAQLQRDAVRVSIESNERTTPQIDQSAYIISREQKQPLLRHILEDGGVERALVFMKTKHSADRLCKQLRAHGVSSDAIHGNKAQGQRERALARFRTGHSRVLVATDVAARGLDVDGISHVINFDLPRETESYVHRIGRTGRAGARGKAITFCEHAERRQLRKIEQFAGQRIDIAGAPHGLAVAEPPSEPRRFKFKKRNSWR